jgi:hypothetical protein
MQQVMSLDKESRKSGKRERSPDLDSAKLAIALIRAKRLNGCNEAADAIAHIALQ